MTARNHGTVLDCDACGAREAFKVDDVSAVAFQTGWRARLIGHWWRHFCPSCKAPADTRKRLDSAT